MRDRGILASKGIKLKETGIQLVSLFYFVNNYAKALNFPKKYVSMLVCKHTY